MCWFQYKIIFCPQVLEKLEKKKHLKMFEKGLNWTKDVRTLRVSYFIQFLSNSLAGQYASLHNLFKQQGRWRTVLKRPPGNTNVLLI